MSRKMLVVIILLIIIVPAVGLFTYDFLATPSQEELENPPEFCTHDFTELDKIVAISKFRSTIGHDYSDSFEHDRSMKHYYMPRADIRGTNDKLKVFSPVDGKIVDIFEESHTLSNGEHRGYQIHIEVNTNPEFTVIIFHVNVFQNISIGDSVYAGQQLGYADLREANDFDIAIMREFGILMKRIKLYSYFQVMTDDVFQKYIEHGISTRDELIKTKEEADNSSYSFENPDPNDWVYLDLKDLEKPPKFVVHDFTELDKISEISKFRSTIGHDYSDSFEHDRSMKHYYAPKPEYANTNDSIAIYSPVYGKITNIFQEQHQLSNGEHRGYQIHIQVEDYKMFYIILFHVNKFDNVSVGMQVVAGQQLGYADLREAHDFDIAVERRLDDGRRKLNSYFQVMIDDVFELYQARGIKSRDELIKTKEEADNSPYSFTNPDPNDWVKLNDTSPANLQVAMYSKYKGAENLPRATSLSELNYFIFNSRANVIKLKKATHHLI